MNRKAFIGRSVRLGVLSLAALFTGVLLSRDQLRMDPQCGTGTRCRGCVKLDRCERPQAKKERGDEER